MRRAHRFFALTAAALATYVVAVGTVTGAQAPAAGNPDQAGDTAQTPVFRSGTNFVYVDAYPRRDGRVVEGLTAADFQIFEDGKVQKIGSFEYVRSGGPVAESERREPVNADDGNRQAADPHNRVFVVYLDVMHTTKADSYAARQPILDFLNASLAASDLFAVTTPDVPVRRLSFARRTEGLESELANYQMWGGEDAPDMRDDAERAIAASCAQMGFDASTIEAAIIRLRREDLLMSHLEDLMARLADVRDERKNVLFLSDGWVPQPPATALPNALPSAMPAIGIGRGGVMGLGRDQSGRASTTLCATEAGRLSNIDFEHRFRDFLALAARSNVAFYPIDLGGLRTVAPLGGSIDTLRTLAENTDGRAIVGTNGLSEAARRLADDLAGYYLLGYYPINDAADGKFRKIDVKVNAPRVAMSARRGYLAPSAAMLRAAAAAAAARPPEAAASVTTALGRLGRIRDEAELYSYAVPSPTGLEVVAEIASREIAEGRWTSNVSVTTTVTSAHGDAATATGTLDAGARGVLLHVTGLTPNAGPYRVVTKVSADRLTVEDRIEVSTISGSDALLCPAILSRASASLRAPLRPVADFQFRRTERLHAEWPVLQTLDRRSARVLDRRGQPLPIDLPLTERANGADTIVAVDLPLAGLAEGDYLIELTAEKGSISSRDLVPFRIGR